MTIWQDLVTQYGFERGYQSVKRFANKIRPSQVLQARPVIITGLGEEILLVGYACSAQSHTIDLCR